jgi:GGDEF domain-containing protein
VIWRARTRSRSESGQPLRRSRSVPLLERHGTLSITTSVGAAASSDGNKNELIAAVDSALYMAKREGKNRRITAGPDTAHVGRGE